jgi:CrcB protein
LREIRLIRLGGDDEIYDYSDGFDHTDRYALCVRATPRQSLLSGLWRRGQAGLREIVLSVQQVKILYIGIFGGLGCVSRYLVSGWVYALAGRALPYGTLAVNVAGSFLLGLIMEWSLRSTLLSPELRFGITVGFMGGFTTFSTFSYETVRLLEEGSLAAAGANMVLNLLVCVVAALLGIYLARQF